MKATGIVRRIDDLGRVVIPKEIRRTFRLREGDPLEIFISSSEEVILKKYSPVGDIISYINGYAKTLYNVINLPIVICDNDQIISCAGISKKEVLQRRITRDMEEILSNRKIIYSTKINQNIKVIEGKEYNIIACVPIIISYDVCGAIIIMREGNISSQKSDIYDKLLQTAVGFISNQMES